MGDVLLKHLPLKFYYSRALQVYDLKGTSLLSRNRRGSINFETRQEKNFLRKYGKDEDSLIILTGQVIGVFKCKFGCWLGNSQVESPK